MILIFDYFETLLNSQSMDFNRGLYVFWEKYYKDKCSFDEIKSYGEELFEHLLKLHEEEKEFAFVKEELSYYAHKFGGEVVSMTIKEEADFLMRCNDPELIPGVVSLLEKCKESKIPMYVLSNSGFSGQALMEVLNRFGIGQYFDNLWSSADFGRIKPCKDFFDFAVNSALRNYPEEKKENIVFVGDMLKTDVKGAVNAGIKVVWINRKDEEDTEHLATYTISEINQLEDIIDFIPYRKKETN